jgi:tetratricopeptide (TPR) repeat protein
MSRRGAVILASLLGAAGFFACKKPDPVAVHREKGDELFSKEEWEAAAAEYSLSLEADPKQDKIWERKAGALMNAGKTDQAAASLLKLLDFATSPKEKSETYRKVANIYLQVKKPDEAEKYFLEALKVDPNDTDSLSWLGEIASTRGGARAAQLRAQPAYLEKAVAYYDRAIAVNPAAPIPYVNKRIALFKYYSHEQRLKQEAEQDLQSARGNRGKVEEAKARLAEHEQRAGDLKRQIDELGIKIAELQKAQKEAAATAKTN